MTATITELGKDENWFWSSEPRIVINLINQKKIIDKEKIKTQSMYTACYIWGKNPDDFSDDEKIPGIDIPVNSELLRGFY